MKLTTHKLHKGGRLMPWGKGTVVSNASGFVFLSGNTATADDFDPMTNTMTPAGSPEEQWRFILAAIKNDLEELGTSLDHLVKLTYFVKGPFPSGAVADSPNFCPHIMDEFFAIHCPKFCSDNTPVPSELIGVSALAEASLVVEVVAIAALP